jgi:hypothetical protein
VRLEQLRDIIEQDGTRTKTAAVEARGEVVRDDDGWRFQLPGLPVSYAVATREKLSAGTVVVKGRVEQLRPAAGPIVIEASAVERAPAP